MSVPPHIPTTNDVDTPPIFLGYQSKWNDDDAKLKVAEKSRRTGFTWAEAADDVLIAAQEGGQPVYYIGYNQDMAIEYIEACAMWARVFNQVAGEIKEGIWSEDQEDRHIKTYTIKFPGSGKRIVALSSRPANLRGKQGVVIIDEAAFHDSLDELLKAAMALLIWGGKVRVISTHNGDKNAFNELIKDIRAGKRKGSVHYIDFRGAVEQGLYKRVCLRLGINWTQEGEDAWVEEVYAFYGDSASEELDVIPSQGSGIAIPRVFVERAMQEERPVIALSLEADFVKRSTDYRESWCRDWIAEYIDPILEDLDPDLQHDFGEDFGRYADLSIIAPMAVLPNLTRRVPFIVELHNVPSRQQEQILWHIIDHLPHFHGGAMDATGSGFTLAEYTADRYGHDRIQMVMLNDAWYRDNMVPFQSAFEDNTIDLPKDTNTLNDVLSLKKVDGIIKLPKIREKDAKDKKIKRHGDAAIGLAMGYFSTLQDVPDTTILTAEKRQSSTMFEGFA